MTIVEIEAPAYVDPLEEIPVLDEVQDTIRKAIELIRKDGWTTGFLNSPSGRRCLIGALDAARFL